MPAPPRSVSFCCEGLRSAARAALRHCPPPLLPYTSFMRLVKLMGSCISGSAVPSLSCCTSRPCHRHCSYPVVIFWSPTLPARHPRQASGCWRGPSGSSRGRHRPSPYYVRRCSCSLFMALSIAKNTLVSYTL